MFDQILEEATVLTTPLVGFAPVDKLSPSELLAAQAGAASWLAELGVKDDTEVVEEEQRANARTAFASMVSGASPADQRAALMKLNVPVAVQAMVGMLCAYDWEFIQQAKEMRGYAVHKILEDCEHPEARHRLKALEMLGKITEVGLFTDQVRVTKIDMTDEALEAKIKAKLEKFRHVLNVPAESSELIDITNVIEHAPHHADAQGA